MAAAESSFALIVGFSKGLVLCQQRIVEKQEPLNRLSLTGMELSASPDIWFSLQTAVGVSACPNKSQFLLLPGNRSSETPAKLNMLASWKLWREEIIFRNDAKNMLIKIGPQNHLRWTKIRAGVKTKSMDPTCQCHHGNSASLWPKSFSKNVCVFANLFNWSSTAGGERWCSLAISWFTLSNLSPSSWLAVDLLCLLDRKPSVCHNYMNFWS